MNYKTKYFCALEEYKVGFCTFKNINFFIFVCVFYLMINIIDFFVSVKFKFIHMRINEDNYSIHKNKEIIEIVIDLGQKKPNFMTRRKTMTQV